MFQASVCPAPSHRHSYPRRLIATFLVVLLTVVFAACSSSTETDLTDGGYVSSDGSITFVAPLERVAAPVLEGSDLDGAPLSSEQFAGQVVVVNVWGSWCPPCRKEMPDLIQLADEFADDQVQFLGIAIRESATASRAFAANFEMNFPSFSDSGGQLLTKFSESLPTVAVPTTYLIDAQGRMAVRYLDQVDENTLRELIIDVRDGR